jgi:hypothetical protein
MPGLKPRHTSEAMANATADPYGITNKKSNGNSKCKYNGNNKQQIPCGDDKQEMQLQEQNASAIAVEVGDGTG